ncbi:MAG: ATP-dependent zinc metalloprotease FtsH, partial [Opitutaceae bacterium]|nr:ATP-dependent zinc metalloprotease FtsH [Opitutaceae bacterium]
MNKNVIVWLSLGVGLFVAFACLDFYLAYQRPDPAALTRGVRQVSMAEFLTKAREGDLMSGKIGYFSGSQGLAEVRAEEMGAPLVEIDGRRRPEVLRSTGRLTDADITLLRERRFLEGDLAWLRGPAGKKTFGDLALPIVDTVTQVLGITLLFVGAAFVLMKVAGRSHAFSAKTFQPVNSSVRFASVAGCNEAKEEVSEIVEFLKAPERFRATGGRMPKGVLLVGPPGTGKTMLAKAVAGESKAKFYSLSGSDFVELYVGVGASRVRSLFREARRNAPSIIFIDEIDAVGRQRGSSATGNQEHEQTLNALLVEMDGFSSGDAVVVFAATNRADIIDKALQRPGRFDRQVYVGLPDLRGREEILRVHAAAVRLDASVDLNQVAKATSGFSGADLANLINEGALHAARRNRTTVLREDLEEARDKISWGRENARILSEEDRRIIAYHEAGHALMQVLSEDRSVTLHKVTIIPRGGSLGSTHFSPEKDLVNFSQSQIVARIRCLMAGRVAEEIALGSVTSGASADIQQATSLARQMVFEWGMSPLGFLALGRPDRAESQASAQTMYEAEQCMKSLLAEQYRQTTHRLEEHRAVLDGIANALMERETIS